MKTKIASRIFATLLFAIFVGIRSVAGADEASETLEKLNELASNCAKAIDSEETTKANASAFELILLVRGANVDFDAYRSSLLSFSANASKCISWKWSTPTVFDFENRDWISVEKAREKEIMRLAKIAVQLQIQREAAVDASVHSACLKLVERDDVLAFTNKMCVDSFKKNGFK